MRNRIILIKVAVFLTYPRALLGNGKCWKPKSSNVIQLSGISNQHSFNKKAFHAFTRKRRNHEVRVRCLSAGLLWCYVIAHRRGCHRCWHSLHNIKSIKLDNKELRNLYLTNQKIKQRHILVCGRKEQMTMLLKNRCVLHFQEKFYATFTFKLH